MDRSYPNITFDQRILIFHLEDVNEKEWSISNFDLNFCLEAPILLSYKCFNGYDWSTSVIFRPWAIQGRFHQMIDQLRFFIRVEIELS